MTSKFRRWFFGAKECEGNPNKKAAGEKRSLLKVVIEKRGN